MSLKPRMPDERQTPPGVVLFDRTAGQKFDNSNLSAAGRDQINVSINLATGSAGHQHPSLVVQGSRPPTQRHSLLSRVHRRLPTRSRRQSRSGTRTLQESVNVTQCLTQVAPEHPTPGPPPSSPSSDVDILADGSSITSLDSRSQSSLVRLHASSAEEVYERSLLPKGHGFPLFNPRPLERPARFGDFGILGQDGFDSFGNLFDPKDQQEFSIDRPPQPNLKHQPEKLHEGLVISAGVGDVRRLVDADTKATNRLELHCREPRGAALVLTSSGDLETLTAASGNQLREYLRLHGTQLIIRLRQKYYLQPGQSLYVVTGTIKSDSWAIAVHTLPMREGYDQMVLTRREGMLGAPFPTHEWTRLGSADARCEASKVIDVDGRRIKDQCLFLRGFLLTPSLDLGQQRKTRTSADSPGGDSSSSPDSTDSEKGDDKGGKGGPANSRQHKSLEPNHHSTSSEGSFQHQLQDIFRPVNLVQPFPATTSDLKSYYPSRRINDTLLEGESENLAITHDDDWIDSLKISDNYLDDEVLSTLVVDFWGKRLPICSQGVATTIPVVDRVEMCQTNGPPSSAAVQFPSCHSPLPSTEGTSRETTQNQSQPDVPVFHMAALEKSPITFGAAGNDPVSQARSQGIAVIVREVDSVETNDKTDEPQSIQTSSHSRYSIVTGTADALDEAAVRPRGAIVASQSTSRSPKASKNGNKRLPKWVPRAMKSGTKSGWGRRVSKQGVEKNRETPFVGVISFGSEGFPSNTTSTTQRFSEDAIQSLDRAFVEKKPKGTRARKSVAGRPRPVQRGPPTPTISTPAPSLRESESQAVIHGPQPAYALETELAEVKRRNGTIDEQQPSSSSYPDVANSSMQSDPGPYSLGAWNVGNDGPRNNYFTRFNPQAGLGMGPEDLGSTSGQTLGYFQTMGAPNISVSPPGACSAPQGQYGLTPQSMYDAHESRTFLANKPDQSNTVNILAQDLSMGDFAAMPGEHTPPNNQPEAYGFYGYLGNYF